MDKKPVGSDDVLTEALSEIILQVLNLCHNSESDFFYNHLFICNIITNR